MAAINKGDEGILKDFKIQANVNGAEQRLWVATRVCDSGLPHPDLPISITNRTVSFPRWTKTGTRSPGMVSATASMSD